MIELLHDLFDVLIARLIKIRPLRQVLAYQTMGIFIDAPRPGGAGMSKIDISAEPLCNGLMPGKPNSLSRVIVKIFAFSVSIPSTAALAEAPIVCQSDAE